MGRFIRVQVRFLLPAVPIISHQSAPFVSKTGRRIIHRKNQEGEVASSCPPANMGITPQASSCSAQRRSRLSSAMQAFFARFREQTGEASCCRSEFAALLSGKFAPLRPWLVVNPDGGTAVPRASWQQPFGANNFPSAVRIPHPQILCASRSSTLLRPL